MRGRKITLLKKNGVRYTSTKVREAIFNILGDIEGKKVLDLFAGSGSFTIEALSRGAASATSVEIDKDMVTMLEKNLAYLDLKTACQVLAMDVLYALPFLAKRGFTCDIIFADPPYDKGYVGELMVLLTTNRLSHDGTTVVIEHSKREMPVFSDLKGWYQGGTKSYGDTCITLLQSD